MSNSLQSIIMKFHFFCYITAIVLVKLNSIYSMFWHVRITVYLKEKEPNYHVHRYICSISCKHGIWGHVILPKNIQKTFSKFIKKTVYFPLWNRVLWGRIRLCIIIWTIMWNHIYSYVRDMLQQFENICKNTILVTAFTVFTIYSLHI